MSRNTVIPGDLTVQRSKPQQAPALDEVFSRHVDPVYRFLYRHLGNRQDAEDLTSAVFLKTTQQLDSDRTEAGIAQWLFTAARMVLADHWRRYYRTGAALSLDDTRTGLMAGEERPVEAIRNPELVEQLLALLPERYRLVLELRFLKGYSSAETASELGMTTENVKAIQHRALTRAADRFPEVANSVAGSHLMGDLAVAAERVAQD